MMTTPGPVLAPDEIPLRIDLTCPGDPACPTSGDTTLYAGTAKRDVTPLVEPFVDLNGNSLWDDGEPFTDRNGNGQFDPVWLAGRDNGVLAFDVHDPVWLRCYALRQGNTTLAQCVIDALGWFDEEEWRVRQDLDPSLKVSLVMLSSTHCHHNQDLVGGWGVDETHTGYDPAYMLKLRAAVVSAITESVHNLKPAKMSIGSEAAESGPMHDMTNYVSDTRDPVILDNRLHIMQFDDATSGAPIVSVINWGAHPDSLGSRHHYISSDFVHYLRETFEAATGSPSVYVTSEVGGQIGPGRVVAITSEGKTIVHDEQYDFVDAWGTFIGKLAVEAWKGRVDVTAPMLAFRHTTWNVHVENIVFQTAAILHVYNRGFFGFDPKKPLLRTMTSDNTPVTTTEAAYLTLGPASIITGPCEVFPESFLGGYDGSYSGTWPIEDKTQPNYPPLEKAPKPPYLRDLMPGAVENRMVFGLTLDFLGYVVPQYNFVLNPDAPYISEATGDHYEETNSVGSRAEPEIIGTMRQLITYPN